METKVLEILDRATYIPVIAIKMQSDESEERKHLRRSGWDEEFPMIVLLRMTDLLACYSAWDWRTPGRTMREAHFYIGDHFDELKSGDIIDVEFILKETTQPKESDCKY